MRWMSGDGVTLDVLAPSLPFLVNTGDDVNENSIVVMLHYDGLRELFMGDAGEASETRLLAANDDLQTSLRSAIMGLAMRPRQRLRPRSGRAGILRTDQCGAILLTVQLPPTTMLRCVLP